MIIPDEVRQWIEEQLEEVRCGEIYDAENDDYPTPISDDVMQACSQVENWLNCQLSKGPASTNGK